jgi:hypothetical protein
MAGEVGRISHDREAQVCEVQADLIGATGVGDGLEEGGAVREETEYAELGLGVASSGWLDFAAT